MCLKSDLRNTVLAQNSLLLSCLAHEWPSSVYMPPIFAPLVATSFVPNGFFSSHFCNGACVSCIPVASSPSLFLNLGSLCDLPNICFRWKFSTILLLWNGVCNENASFLRWRRFRFRIWHLGSISPHLDFSNEVPSVKMHFKHLSWTCTVVNFLALQSYQFNIAILSSLWGDRWLKTHLDFPLTVSLCSVSHRQLGICHGAPLGNASFLPLSIHLSWVRIFFFVKNSFPSGNVSMAEFLPVSYSVVVVFCFGFYGKRLKKWDRS